MELCNTIIKSSVESASSYVYWTAICVVNQHLTDRVVSGFLAHQNCIFNDSTTPDSIARPANEFVCWYHSVKTLHLQIIVVKCRCQVQIMTPTDRTTFYLGPKFRHSSLLIEFGFDLLCFFRLQPKFCSDDICEIHPTWADYWLQPDASDPYSTTMFPRKKYFSVKWGKINGCARVTILLSAL